MYEHKSSLFMYPGSKKMTSISKDNVIESCKQLLQSAIYVNLASDLECSKIAEELKSSIKSFDPFEEWKANHLNPQNFNEAAIDWIFLCDLLNFSFWQDDPEKTFSVEFDGKVYQGYWTLPATLNRFPQLIDPKFYSKITAETFNQIFKPEFTLAEERIRLMQEAGKVLVEKYNGTFVEFLKVTGTDDVWSFINRLIQEFPSFYDFNNQFSVWFLKRAQILVADLWAASRGKFFASTVDQLTIFADYRIPQVLNSLGLITYHQLLKEKLFSKELLPAGCREEAEIRAASIIMCERLKNGLECSAVELDFYLWEYSQEIKNQVDSVYPFHRTRSIYY